MAVVFAEEKRRCRLAEQQSCRPAISVKCGISFASAKSSVTVSVKVKSDPCCIVISRPIPAPAHAACSLHFAASRTIGR